MMCIFRLAWHAILYLFHSPRLHRNELRGPAAVDLPRTSVLNTDLSLGPEGNKPIAALSTAVFPDSQKHVSNDMLSM
jgi:hypothetical protein